MPDAPFRAGDAIAIHYSGMSGHAQDWITVQPASAPDNTFGKWAYTKGVKSGRFTVDGLSPGDYEARAYFAWPEGGYKVQARVGFKVLAKAGKIDKFGAKPAKLPPLVQALQGKWVSKDGGAPVVFRGHTINQHSKDGPGKPARFAMYDSCAGWHDQQPKPTGGSLVIVADEMCYGITVKGDAMAMTYVGARLYEYGYVREK